jgi:hypothetical protein
MKHPIRAHLARPSSRLVERHDASVGRASVTDLDKPGGARRRRSRLGWRRYVAGMTVVVALGAWCDLVPPEESTASPGGASFAVQEFAVLEDGRRVTLHAERGWTSWVRGTGRSEPLDPWDALTEEGIQEDVLNVVLPDDDASGEPHEWAWLRDLLSRHGVETTVEHLKSVPYTVELSDRLLQRLRA